ncbi:protein FAM210B, mitochondrial [Rhineura floridana]|uniref:protein FAM210B, mitochondrial n=1 Tax=Rhineura floridana TaxID=261503 RepID=UPI002AC87340|nr:protein FAM210B, mitochondrial [Rhineura floridana]
MLWLGQLCALHALCPGGQLQVASRSAAFREAATSCLQAAGAGAGLLSGQVHLSPAAQNQGPRRRHSWGSRRLHRLSSISPLQSPVRFLFPAAGADPRSRESEPLLLLLLIRPPKQLEGEAAGPLRLRSEITLQATGSKFSAGGGGGDSSSLGSRKETSGSAENNHTHPNQENGKKPNKSQQLKKVFKEYGAVGVTFHVGISLVSLGMFYLAVSSGVDMTAILFKLGFDEALVQSKLAAGTSAFVLAYAIHKLFAPVRISITLISVPLLVRYFRKISFFKPPAPNP